MQYNRALIIVDMLNDFVLDDAPLKVKNIENIIKPIQREINKACREDYPVIYICDSHDKKDAEFDIYPPHAVSGTKGAAVIDSLKPADDDIIVNKKTLLGFYKTDLEKILKKNKIAEIFLTGCVVNICIFLIAIESIVRGYKVNVIKDAVIGFNKKDYDYSLEQLKDYFNVNLI